MLRRRLAWTVSAPTRAAWLVAAACLAPLVAPSDAEAGKRPRLLASGQWGGEHVQLDVAADGARIEFDCGHGSITEPFALKPDGGFDLAGTYTREGGPTRQD